MRRNRFYLLLPLLALIAGCSDYPPIDPYLTFNINRSANFGLPNTENLNQDINLVATGSIDTNDYIKNSSSAYLLRTSEVWRVYLQSNDPNYTLDQLTYARILIGSDTIAFDSIPQGTVDTNFTLTKADITKYMRDTSFTATLQCRLASAPANPTTITCGMTIVHTAIASGLAP
ncbi:MAG TPA: hypothetical protein VFH95_01140 [Candidatus Kapabacteria bacterium]|nr:hypothetical protein [Candidatus Kapabacteria bacterium]